MGAEVIWLYTEEQIVKPMTFLLYHDNEETFRYDNIMVSGINHLTGILNSYITRHKDITGVDVIGFDGKPVAKYRRT
jgi:hypothetical protein